MDFESNTQSERKQSGVSFTFLMKVCRMLMSSQPLPLAANSSPVTSVDRNVRTMTTEKKRNKQSLIKQSEGRKSDLKTLCDEKVLVWFQRDNMFTKQMFNLHLSASFK